MTAGPRRRWFRSIFMAPIVGVAMTAMVLVAEYTPKKRPIELSSFRTPVRVISTAQYSDGGTIEVVLADAGDIKLTLRISADNRDWGENRQKWPPKALLVGRHWDRSQKEVTLPMSRAELASISAFVSEAVANAPAGENRDTAAFFLEYISDQKDRLPLFRD